MFSSRVLVAIVALAATTIATNSTCWLGNIGDHCYDHDTGCSYAGAKLTCAKPNTGIDEMIFYDACYPPDNKRSKAGHGTCYCLPGGVSDCSIGV